MESNTSHRQRAQTQSKRVAREPIPLTERVALSPAQFAALCGRSPTWAYRQIYAGRIKPICDFGRLLIPRSEMESFLASKAEYNPVKNGGGR
jgi:Helix-turn-helix domain